jgi:hypothetical protein
VISMDAGSRPASFAMSRNFGRTSAISPRAVGIQPPVSLHLLRHCRSSRRPPSAGLAHAYVYQRITAGSPRTKGYCNLTS